MWPEHEGGVPNMMIKKYIFSFLLMTLSCGAVAADQAQLKIKIANAIQENKYFLCLYGVGCLSIHAGNQGKVFAVNPIDMNNIKKVGIANITSRALSLQPNDASCQIPLQANQSVTITGKLVVKHNTPQIEHLHCSAA
jgi:hypothetical protein